MSDTPDINLYGYVPTRWICLLFVVLYGLTTGAHVFQVFRHLKKGVKFMFLTAILCGIIDTVGWACRHYSSNYPTKFLPWVVQYLTTFIAPTPLLATDFVVFGRLIRLLGEDYSRLGPRMYSIVFLSFDIFAILVQVGGGVMAGAAAGNNEDPTLGTNIMLGGIIFQLIAMGIFFLSISEYTWRYYKDKPIRNQAQNVASASQGTLLPRRRELRPKLKYALYLVFITMVLLFIRGIYRLIEFVDGWDGKIQTTEAYMNIFDGAPIFLVLFLWNIGHPGVLLDPVDEAPSSEDKYQLVERAGSPFPPNDFPQNGVPQNGFPQNGDMRYNR